MLPLFPLHPWPEAGDSARSLGAASLYALDLRSPLYTLDLTPAGKLVETRQQCAGRQQCGGRSPRDVLLDAALKEAPPSARGDVAMRGAGVSRQRGAGMGLSKPLSKPCLGAVPYSAAAGAGIQDRVPWQRTAMSPLAAAARARLPAGWEQHADEQATPYYHNAIEGVTTWRRPGGSRRGGSDGARAGRHAHASRHRQQRDQQRGRHSAPRCAHGTADAAQGDGDDSGGDSGGESVNGGGGGGRRRDERAAHGGEGGAAAE